MATSVPDPQILVPLSMLEHHGLTVSARLVWLRLRGHLNRKTGQCNPRQAVLARELSVSIDTVQRAIVQLRRVGAVTIKRSQYGCSYTFQIPQERGSETDSDTAKCGLGNRTSAEAKPQNAVSEVAVSLLTELSELNQENEPAAAAVDCIHSGARAAAAACVSGVPKNPTPPGHKAKTETANLAENFPQEKKSTPEAEALVAELMPLHPEPGNAIKATAEVAKLLSDASGEVSATVEAIRASHGLWRVRWADYAPGRFIPQLWRWIAEGDWRNAPVDRKSVQRETYAERVKREQRESDEESYRVYAENGMWDALREYGGDELVEVWRAKVEAVA